MDNSKNFVVLSSRMGNFACHKIESVNFKSNVSTIRGKAAQLLEFPGDQIELIYCGQCLSDDRNLEDYKITPGSTVHVFQKVKLDDLFIEPVDLERLKELRRATKSVLKHKDQKAILQQLLQDENIIENLKAAIPGLDNDPIALGYLRDLDMFALAATSEKEKLEKLVKAHPTFGHAALNLIATVSEEAAKERPKQTNYSDMPTSREAFALDRVSDDDDDLDDDDGSEAMEIEGNALSMNQNGASGSRPGVITADFFRQAMTMAAGGNVNPVNQPQASRATEDQLRQLREMGITDEAVARRALEQAGGDLNLALEMLFGDMM